MNILLISGSLRADSLNKKLLKITSNLLAEIPECKSSTADIKSLGIPVYDGDVEQQGIPDGVTELGKLVSQCDALIISTPEYNGSIAGSLKNTIDWVSRLRPVPFENKPVLLMGATPGGFATIRALAATKAPLEALGCYVYPQTFGLPKAHEAMVNGDFADAAVKKRLHTLLTNYSTFAHKLK